MCSSFDTSRPLCLGVEVTTKQKDESYSALGEVFLDYKYSVAYVQRSTAAIIEAELCHTVMQLEQDCNTMISTIRRVLESVAMNWGKLSLMLLKKSLHLNQLCVGNSLSSKQSRGYCECTTIC